MLDLRTERVWKSTRRLLLLWYCPVATTTNAHDMTLVHCKPQEGQQIRAFEGCR